MNAKEIIGNAMGKSPSNEVVDHIVWGRTPFPFKEITAKHLYKAAHRFKRANDNNIILCDFCDNKAVIDYTCKKCRKALDRAKAECQ